MSELPAPLSEMFSKWRDAGRPRDDERGTSSRRASASDLRLVVFVDVETTGLGVDDRIVGFGGVKLSLDAPGEITTLNLLFNPGRPCAAGATRVHGWSDKALANQDPIDAYAPALRRWLDGADLLVAHHAAFDIRFLNQAFTAHGAPPVAGPTECTMLDYRSRGEGSAALDDIAARMGLPARRAHTALEDAWRCMQVWLWLRNLPWRLDFALAADPGPANFRAAAARRPTKARQKKAAAPRVFSAARYSSPYCRALAVANWAAAVVPSQGFPLAATVDGERCHVHSFSPRSKESFYVNLTIDSGAEGFSLVHSHHDWQIEGGGDLAQWATKAGAVANA